MRRAGTTGLWSWVAAAGVGALTGLALWWYVVSPATVARPRSGNPETTPAIVDIREATALRYAKAFQEGAWDDVIALTWWMQERLERVAVASSDPEAEEEARRVLRARLRERTVEGNQLRPEGIEDQYIFPAGARLEVVYVDDGHEDLAKPVEKRVWIRVIYPTLHEAPRDLKGDPIRFIVVGVSVSTDGFILKASVVGNLEIGQVSARNG